MSINPNLKTSIVVDPDCHAGLFSTQVTIPHNLIEEADILKKAVIHRNASCRKKKSKKKSGWRYWLLKARLSKVLKAFYKYLFDGFMVNNHLR